MSKPLKIPVAGSYLGVAATSEYGANTVARRSDFESEIPRTSMFAVCMPLIEPAEPPLSNHTLGLGSRTLVSKLEYGPCPIKMAERAVKSGSPLATDVTIGGNGHGSVSVVVQRPDSPPRASVASVAHTRYQRFSMKALAPTEPMLMLAISSIVGTGVAMLPDVPSGVR
jgi:hypothetical protein